MRPFFKTLKDLVNHFFSSTPTKQPPVAVVAPAVHKPYEDPKPPIKKVAVIGAGVMGAGIAAQFANAGIDVVLLDKFPGAAQNAIDKMLKATPATDAMNAGLMLKNHAKRITVGTTDDNMGMIADADWIVEVVPEILPIKHATFRQLTSTGNRAPSCLPTHRQFPCLLSPMA
jgi:threonine dehydrogenase-like Zn-dependent dehydrogenase